MRIAVIGAGAVGGYFGGRLAAAGEEVHFLARGDHFGALVSTGLHIESPLGDAHLFPVHATDNPASIGPVDIVLVTVKTWQLPAIAPHLASLLQPDTGVIPLENGVDASDQLAAMVGREHVLSGMARIFSTIAAPGVIRHTGAEAFLAFGELNNARSDRAVRFLAALTHARVNATIPTDIHQVVWEKCVFLTALSGVSAVTRSPAGIIRTLPGTRSMLQGAMQETVAIAQKKGVPLDNESIVRAMALIDALPELATPSMQRDILAGRPSELASQNGAMVRLGQELGVATPTHEFLYQALLPQELAARA